MTRRNVILATAAWLGLLVFAGFEAHRMGQQRVQQRSLLAQQHQFAAEGGALRREHSALVADLIQAEQQLVALAFRSDMPDTKLEHREEIARWLAGVRKLRQLFAARSDLAVPEMQFLKDEDWLRSAKMHPLETDGNIRDALAEIRGAGIGYFTGRISAALRNYNAATKNERPTTIQALAPHFDEPVDPLLLERYAIIDRPNSGGGASGWAVANKTPIDADYDWRYFLTGDSENSGVGLLVWRLDVDERYTAAAAKYRQANPTQPSRSSIDDFLPYFDPPLEADLADRLRRIETEAQRGDAR